MNRAQVLDAWRLDGLRRDREEAADRAAAVEWVSEHSELCGEDGAPCSFAVELARHYKRLGGSFDVAVVRRHRDMKVARIIERLEQTA